MNYNGETSSCGGAEWAASAELTNLGSEAVTSAMFEVTIGGTTENVDWSGDLGTGATQTVDLGTFTATETSRATSLASTAKAGMLPRP